MSNELGPLELPGGGCVVVRRSRATVEQDFASKAPTIQKSVWNAAEIARKGTAGEMSATIPVSEVVALIEFFVFNTVRVEGRPGVTWGEMGAAERRYFFDDLGASPLLKLYMGYLWLRIKVDRPEVVEQINAKIAAAVAAGEEE